MKWAKIPTEFLFKLSDREIVAVAKYVMLYGVLETVPTRSECLRVMSEKQLETIQKHFETISKIISADINIAQYDRDRKKQKKAEICAIQQKNPTESTTENPTESTTDIPKDRIDKNRLERKIVVDTTIKEISSFQHLQTPIQVWLDYKRSRGEKYKSPQSLAMFAKKLNELSNGDADIAQKIIEQSMANNWAGIFALHQSRADPPSDRRDINDPDNFVI